MNNIDKYNKKRNFNKTKEPIGKQTKSSKKLRFVIQHHLARKDHYDFRLEYNGVLKSWAVPKGPSFNPSDKRLAIQVEDHPLSYRNFEGIIPQGEYGGGTVMLWDKGYWEPFGNPKNDFKNGSIKFILNGERLKGIWALVRMQDDNWLLIKDKDQYSKKSVYINKYKTSIKSNKTIDKIGKKSIVKITLSNSDKNLFENPNITKNDIANYYEKVYERMAPYLKKRLISVIRCPDGTKGTCFYKKHPESHNKGINKYIVLNKNKEKEEYYYIKNLNGLIEEVQMNTIEFHIWGSIVNNIEKPDIMVFDFDPDEKMNLDTIRQGVRDLKSILDKLSLISFLKTSGGKGYHVVIPITPSINWQKFKTFAKNIALLMEAKWPERYTTNVRKNKRKNKIFIDWMRNMKGATSVAPYSLRIRKTATISMPIKWSELDKITPNEIEMVDAIKRLKRKDPWANFFEINQQLK